MEEMGMGVNKGSWPVSLVPTFGHHGLSFFHPSGPHILAFFFLSLDLLIIALLFHF